MRGKKAKLIRKAVKNIFGIDKTNIQYIEQERVIVVKGWVNVDGELVEKSVPIKAMGERTHAPNTFKDRVKFFKNMVRQGVGV